jgi:hypothetical protein
MGVGFRLPILPPTAGSLHARAEISWYPLGVFTNLERIVVVCVQRENYKR